LQPTELELEKQCVPKVKLDEPKLTELKDASDAATSKIGEAK
jgi:hypothetical protein